MTRNSCTSELSNDWLGDSVTPEREGKLSGEEQEELSVINALSQASEQTRNWLYNWEPPDVDL